MSSGAKLAGFGLVLVAMLGIGAAIGGAVGPIDVDDAEEHEAEGHGDEHVDGAEDGAPSGALPVGGLLVSQDGYTLVPEDRSADPGELAFVIEGPDGEPVQDLELLHDRELHLIVASGDLQEYAHLHPERDDEGRWTVELPDLAPGAYRAFADFQPADGEQLTLGIDLTREGSTEPSAPLAPVATDEVAGYEVTLEQDLSGTSGEVTVTVREDGEVVTTEPYLGAAGHLVALRDGDLAYLHVHPLGEEPNGPVGFVVEVPSAGTYALFFDFQVDGEVHTARFVVEVPSTDGAGSASGEPSATTPTPSTAAPSGTGSTVDDHGHTDDDH
ncbi:hypothetical protein B7486_55040 [cyanobacterium TDX16]|nr:hypothetical protein B7486_55040 [cyanobacterium TDX16]